MHPVLIVGTIIMTGYLLGGLANRVGLPKVTGYILAGIALNPTLTGVVPESFVDHTDLIVNIVLCLITFSVGGTLKYSRIKKLGKGIVYMTVLEAELAFAAVFLGFLIVLPLFGKGLGITGMAQMLPFALVLGGLASATDPSATLAVAHEYGARGPVSSTIMGVAAFDDALGIINFSLALSISRILLAPGGGAIHPGPVLLAPLLTILKSLLVGVAFGFAFNFFSMREARKRDDALIIVLMLGLLTACFGVAKLVGGDELFSTMVVGVVVINFNPARREIFSALQNYLEELVFVLFFTLSGMHLDVPALLSALGLIPFFVLLRALGKSLGAVAGGLLSGTPSRVWRYVPGGLIPQGGIVIGLALLMRQEGVMGDMAGTVVSLIIGATVIHEFVGPVLAKITLSRAGEIGSGREAGPHEE